MRILRTAALVLLFTALGADVALGAIPKPAPRPQQRAAQKSQKERNQNQKQKKPSGTEADRTLEELRQQYPNLIIPASTDVQWITPTGNGAEADIQNSIDNNAVLYSPNPHQVAQYEDEDPQAPTEQELRDAQLAQYWLDVKEDLALREVDNKALALVKEFSGGKNAVPPVQGQNGALNYAYGNHVPKIVCRPNRITDIALQAGEKVTAVHAGDTTRWQISPAKSGSGEQETIHVVVKPLIPDISTNLLVMTDRRTYNLDLVSSATNYIPSVRFSYPDDVIGAWGSFIAESRKKQQQDVVLSDGKYSLLPDNLYFGYSIVKGKEVAWSPIRVFDDGVKTYIEMPAKYQSLEAPVLLFYEGQQQKLVNYRVKDRFYIVDRLMTKKAVLIAGKSRVVIERKKEGSGQ